MMKKYRGFLCLCVIATLLFVMTNVYATGEEVSEGAAGVTQEELNALIRGAKIQEIKTVEVTRDGNQYGTEQYSIVFSNIQGYNAEKRHFEINGREYDIEVRYQNENGEYISSGRLASAQDENGNIVVALGSRFSIPEGTEYEIGLVEADDFKDTMWSQNKKQFQSKTVEEAGDQYTSAGKVVGDLVTGNIGGAMDDIRRIVVESICRILVPMGDSFLDMICNAVGEVATIDRVVYGDLRKTDIDFFQNGAGGEATGQATSTPLKETMGNVINPLYRLFRGIAITVYMVILVYIGLRILLGSTATKKADYKSLLAAWVVGVAMIFFFPYVMKYTIQLNNALCQSIGGGGRSGYKAITSLEPSTYGKDEFLQRMQSEQGGNNANDMMLYVRTSGSQKFNIPLIIIYFIMIGQLLALLIMYYKRVFMLAFLISIFPLVAMIYPLTRVGAVRMNPFGVWMKEFCINVFVQSFHAATYKVIVTIGIEAYATDQNWLFMILCILFLFEGEKIIRALFGAESSANTIGTIAMSGALAWKFVKGASSLLPDLGKKDADEKEDKDKASDKAKKDMKKPLTTPGAAQNLANASTSSASGTASGTSLGATASSTPPVPTTPGTVSVTLGRNPAEAGTASPMSTVEKQLKDKGDTFRRKLTEGVVGTAGSLVQFGTQGAGAMIGGAYGLAQSDENAAVTGMASGAAIGNKIGGGVKNITTGIVRKTNDIIDGRILAGEYLAGAHDDEIGITEADAQLDKEKSNAMREVYAKLSKRTAGFSSKERAEIKFIKERLDVTKQ